MRRRLLVQAKKIIRRPRLTTAAATYDTRSGFYITDQLTGMRYLIDTGAFCSVYPASRHEINTIDVDPLQLTATNGSNITSHDTKHINLRLANRSCTWKFRLAEVTQHLLGVDFLAHHHLFVDIAKRRLIPRHPIWRPNHCVLNRKRSMSTPHLRLC